MRKAPSWPVRRVPSSCLSTVPHGLAGPHDVEPPVAFNATQPGIVQSFTVLSAGLIAEGAASLLIAVMDGLQVQWLLSRTNWRWHHWSASSWPCCETHGSDSASIYSPVTPSMRSRIRSAWPLWRAYSSIMCR